jgi:ribosomal protein S18 acetylase RimI-like enzyme
VAADGGRIKLEWTALRSRPADGVHDLLCWDGDRLLGFLGIYGFSRKQPELTGMVDPEARRRGIGRALFDAALPICREQHKRRLLLVVPRSSPGGHDLARAYGMSFDHSEHALTLRERPEPARSDGRIRLRAATTDDIPLLSRLYDDAFHDGGHVDPSRLASDHSRTLLVLRENQAVGTVALAQDGARGAIHAFVVGSEWRGRGIGGEALRRACLELFDAGAVHVDLEVEVGNDGALGLYTALGFELQATDDYYALTI